MAWYSDTRTTLPLYHCSRRSMVSISSVGGGCSSSMVIVGSMVETENVYKNVKTESLKGKHITSDLDGGTVSKLIFKK
jgi:hypothetical protein